MYEFTVSANPSLLSSLSGAKASGRFEITGESPLKQKTRLIQIVKPEKY